MIEEKKKFKVVSAAELLKMKVKPYVVDKKKEMRHCPFHGGILVNKGIKKYIGGNGKEYANPREVCGAGCNTDWKQLAKTKNRPSVMDLIKKEENDWDSEFDFVESQFLPRAKGKCPICRHKLQKRARGLVCENWRCLLHFRFGGWSYKEE